MLLHANNLCAQQLNEMSHDEEMQRPFWGFETWDLRPSFGLENLL